MDITFAIHNDSHHCLYNIHYLIYNINVMRIKSSPQVNLRLFQTLLLEPLFLLILLLSDEPYFVVPYAVCFQ